VSDKLIFEGVKPEDAQVLVKVFNMFREWKAAPFCGVDEVDTSGMVALLGYRYQTQFWHPTEKELKAYNEASRKASRKKRPTEWHSRLNEKYTQNRWIFEAWVDAVLACEIELHGVSVEGERVTLLIEQVAWPCGGHEAMENFGRIFSGVVVRNDLIP